jgi:hypothetical protein
MEELLTIQLNSGNFQLFTEQTEIFSILNIENILNEYSKRLKDAFPDIISDGGGMDEELKIKITYEI